MQKRFPIETKVPKNVILEPRKDTTRGSPAPRAIFLGYTQLEDGSWRYLITSELKANDGGGAVRWSKPRFVSGGALIGSYDLTKYEWKKPEDRVKGVKAINTTLRSQVADLTRQLAELRAKLGE